MALTLKSASSDMHVLRRSHFVLLLSCPISSASLQSSYSCALLLLLHRSKEDIKLKLHDGTLLISGERKEEKENKEGESSWVERSFGSFMRSFKLPENVDAEAITASCKDGVLTVTIPKTEVKKPEAKEIPVE